MPLQFLGDNPNNHLNDDSVIYVPLPSFNDPLTPTYTVSNHYQGIKVTGNANMTINFHATGINNVFEKIDVSGSSKVIINNTCENFNNNFNKISKNGDGKIIINNYFSTAKICAIFSTGVGLGVFSTLLILRIFNNSK